MYDFKTVEVAARKIWKKKSKAIEAAIQDQPKKPLFSFLEGPPSANGPPGLHHLEVRTFKDIICKFKYMKGFSVPRKGGWDCHGLPIEVQVEKALNLKDKTAIETYGVEQFIQKARASVFSYIKEWNASTQELNYWVDLKNPYITLENDYIESVWWSLKELHKKGLLYEGHKVVPFCTRCGTPLSSHEVAQGYKDVKDNSVYVAFKLVSGTKSLDSPLNKQGRKKENYILAWTTTPWTLPGNVALAVGPEIDYVKVKLDDGDTILVGKEKLDLISGKYTIIAEYKGKELIGKQYEPLYDIPETQNKNSHKIIGADFVTTEDGTGVVHTAVMYGEDDYALGLEAGLPEVHTVGQDGKFLPIVKAFAGKYVKDAEIDIIIDLKKRHLLFKKEKFTHSYPFCWRCDSPLLYYGITSWFINVKKIRKELVKLNKQINWEPEHIKDGRFGKWLEGAKDWSLSRFKFWGTPLPVWRCGCGKEKIIGSVEELKAEAVKMPKGDIDLHKPFIDKVKLSCTCGDTMERVSDVIDCWYDSGSAPFAQLHYPFENKKTFEKRFPYDFISEAIDQTRGWFYTMHVLSTILFGKPAYKNVICAGHVVDSQGEKMSKSKGNIIVPREIIDSAGVDAVRLQFCTSDAGAQKRYSLGLMKESVLPFLTVLYNTNNYYAQLPQKKTKTGVEDKWILSRLHTTIRQVTDELNSYLIDKPFEAVRNFLVNDVSRGYIRMTRDRDDTGETLGEILKHVSLLLAPFAPHLSEVIYSQFSKNSVLLSSWPTSSQKKIDKELETIFAQTGKIIEAGLRERDVQHIGLKWPLASTTIFVKGPERFKDVEDLIKTQLNVKSLIFKSPAPKETELAVELDPVLTPELEAEGYARQMVRQIQAFRKKLGLSPKDHVRTTLLVSKKLKDMLDQHTQFIVDKTNSKEVVIVTTCKETFKNKIAFKIKDQKGDIAIIQ